MFVNWMQVAAAEYDRQAVADHANNLATKIRGNLTNSMKALGVDILTGIGSVVVCTHSISSYLHVVVAHSLVEVTTSFLSYCDCLGLSCILNNFLSIFPNSWSPVVKRVSIFDVGSNFSFVIRKIEAFQSLC